MGNISMINFLIFLVIGN